MLVSETQQNAPWPERPAGIRLAPLRRALAPVVTSGGLAQ